ncbi:unnamed protein product [Polarella glacialis]|uniref:UBR-type domain-containing protein n=1 Tax=Polarella glacialis TaxID=89957 RepID=A0A813K7Y7_POLGL|nr:unnamed protein product [Polarella glacialis]
MWLLTGRWKEEPPRSRVGTFTRARSERHLCLIWTALQGGGVGKLVMTSWECLTCGYELVCSACARTCHDGHDLVEITQQTTPLSFFVEESTGYCDCGFNGIAGQCCALRISESEHPPSE